MHCLLCYIVLVCDTFCALYTEIYAAHFFIVLQKDKKNDTEGETKSKSYRHSVLVISIIQQTQTHTQYIVF